jgi:hypothetical protein
MVLSSVSMEVEGELLCDTSTIVGLGGAGASRLSSPHTIALYSLRVDGDVEVSTDGLTCAGDVLMGTGILNLLHTTMQLRGSLLNENEAGYLTGGRVEKTLPAAGGGEKVSTGMGLSITPASSYENLPVARVHDRQHNRGEQSVARYYEFPTAVPLVGVDVAYLNACSPKPAADSYLLYHKAPQGWESLPPRKRTLPASELQAGWPSRWR